jgi:drug/metabolite transporter (DMT)-like permease
LSRRRIGAAYLGVVLVWSTTPLAIQWSAQGAGFAFALLARMSTGWIVCVLALLVTRGTLPLGAHARRVYRVAGSNLAVSMLFTYWGALYVPSGLISVVYGLSPLFTGVFATLWLRQRGLTRAGVAGLALGIAGLWLLFGQALPHGPMARWGLAAVVCGMIVQAAGLVAIKRLRADMAPLAMTTGALSVALPVFALAWVLGEGARVPTAIPVRAATAIVYLGVFGSVIGFSLYYFVIRHMDAGRVALIMLVTPVAALLLGTTFNDEAIAARGWLGIALIGCGLVVYEWRALRTLRNPRRA